MMDCSYIFPMERMYSQIKVSTAASTNVLAGAILRFPNSGPFLVPWRNLALAILGHIASFYSGNLIKLPMSLT